MQQFTLEGFKQAVEIRFAKFILRLSIALLRHLSPEPQRDTIVTTIVGRVRIL
jgi:hypothetical protein